jgi:hypothetical protein
MELITQEQRAALLENGLTYLSNPEFNPFPVVKLFTPWGRCTWLLTDIDAEDDDIASGLCDLGFGEPEIGSVRISELRSIKGPSGLGVERDIFFAAKKTIQDYADEARRHGEINA